jgi:hypothetical protein
LIRTEASTLKPPVACQSSMSETVASPGSPAGGRREGRDVAVPGTGDAEHMIDNLGGGRGRLPTPEHMRRMVELVEALPQG